MSRTMNSMRRDMSVLAVNHVPGRFYQVSMNVKDAGGGKKQPRKNVDFIQEIN